MADLVQQKEGKADIVDMGAALALKEQAPSIDSLDDIVDDSVGASVVESPGHGAAS